VGRSGALGEGRGVDRPANGHERRQTQILQPETTVAVCRIAAMLMLTVV